MSVAMRNLVEPGIITPTPELEVAISEFMELPLPSEAAMDRDWEERVRLTISQGERENALDNPDAPDTDNNNADGSRSGSQTGRPKEV
jgi:hypothetical protein